MEIMGTICLSMIAILVFLLVLAIVVESVEGIIKRVREKREAKIIADEKRIEREIYNRSLLGECERCTQFLNSYTFRTEDGEIFNKSLFINEHGDIEIILSKGE